MDSSQKGDSGNVRGTESDTTPADQGGAERLTKEKWRSDNPGDLIFENQFVWTVDDAAKELQCSVRHIRSLVSDNRIPYGKVGRLVRFSPHRVREWLSKGGTR